jgi:AP-2 complex subunit alpha
LTILGYVLGEYGHLIANEPGYSPTDQLRALQSKSHFAAASTRALLLSTYIKWVNVFPEIKPELVNIFDRYRHVLDTELQQRACEYFAIAARGENDDLLPRICEEMPPFPERESALLGRLHAKHGDTNDKRTWIIGGKDANQDRGTGSKRLATIRRPGGRAAEPNIPPLPAGGDLKSVPGLIPDASDQPSTGPEGDIMSSLAGLNLSSENTAATPSTSTDYDRSAAAERWFDRLTYIYIRHRVFSLKTCRFK